MKKQVTKLSKAPRQLFVYALLASLSFSFNSVQAQDSKPILPSVSLTYAGAIGGQPVFEINFDNSNQRVFDLSIRDENGVVLYSQTVKGKNYSKKFELDDVDLNGLRLTVVVTDVKAKESQKQTFQFNSNSRTIQDVAITQL